MCVSDESCCNKREPPMDLQLTNKKALVTGSTAGIGFAIASLLVEEGASVVVEAIRGSKFRAQLANTEIHTVRFLSSGAIWVSDTKSMRPRNKTTVRLAPL